MWRKSQCLHCFSNFNNESDASDNFDDKGAEIFFRSVRMINILKKLRDVHEITFNDQDISW